MDNKNTNNKVTEFEKRGQAKAKNKEKLIVTASAVFVLTALTITGMYINNNASEKTPIQENNTGISGDMTGDVLQAPGVENIDMQSVDSTTVENPGRTGIVAEQEGDTKISATKSSNTLVHEKADATLNSEELTEAAMSGIVENMMFSFDGMNMIWPVPEGNDILIPYSMDKAVYFETLDQYKYSPAMIIAAEEGTPVCAVSAGKITRRYWDYETGWTYEMDLGGGFKAYYGQLDYLQKAEDTYVAAGDVLGYVAAPTKYFAEEGSNLYFAMTQNGQPVCPENYIGE
ncbi:MAG: M23 family metallopeptidase [Lachnospiraceae bacterium]|nr:M23 family metallopeptidase [Lachnospiraceae bacterium]